jgi:hypothetical protein
MRTRKKAKLVRRTPIGDIVRSEWGDLRLRLPRDRESFERCHQNGRMHELIFANERYFGTPHNALFRQLRVLHLIPKEVIDYRIKCLKGKAPAKVPAIVYEYPPPHRGSPDVPGSWASPWWTYSWILPGGTAETMKHRKVDPKDYVREKIEEIKSSIEHGTEHIESYERCGRRTHPEYAFITDRRRERVESLKAILREKLREERAKPHRRKAA